MSRPVERYTVKGTSAVLNYIDQGSDIVIIGGQMSEGASLYALPDRASEFTELNEETLAGKKVGVTRLNTGDIAFRKMPIFWSIFMNMVLSVRQIDRKIMDSARTLNLNQSSMILHVLLPYSLPGIINSVSVLVSTSFLVLTAAEMIGATSGLGWYIKYNADFANFTKVIAGIFVIGVVVTMLNALISLVKRLLIRWR
ncbi:ABC transporter permease subunit [Clostridiaceae bacterium Marseille-Q4143]|nr:ABC transporter permease subunit [Clostridiaceae bacterium Marseille-Q4143]